MHCYPTKFLSRLKKKKKKKDTDTDKRSAQNYEALGDDDLV